MPDSSLRRVKIVCTLGPSSNTPEIIGELVRAGMDVARLNFSHGDHNFHRNIYKAVREQARANKKNVAILQDLQGPKLRAGALPAEGICLKAGDRLLLFPEGTDPALSPNGKIPIPISAEIAEPISRDVQKGAWILFDDGKISTRAIEVRPPNIVVEVIRGGTLLSRKGMNLPGTPLSIPCCTDKDFEDLKFGLDLGVDAVALSFVRHPSDIEEVRERIEKNSNHRPLVFAKVEREEAVEHYESIADVSDGILVARGDMATELGAERVPVVQKDLIRACNEVGVPVITATQMLESMISSETPTRAEASDVANAVFDGTDAVMLSGETASGQHPIEVVRTMDKVVRGAEQFLDRFSRKSTIYPLAGSIVDSVQFSASRVAQHVGATVITCLTHTGRAARVLAKYRPNVPIVAVMDREEVLRKLAFVWGVQGVLIPKIVATDDLFALCEEIVLGEGWAKSDDLIVVTAGIPTLRRGTTNTIKVHRVGSPIERAGRKF